MFIVFLTVWFACIAMLLWPRRSLEVAGAAPGPYAAKAYTEARQAGLSRRAALRRYFAAGWACHRAPLTDAGRCAHCGRERVSGPNH